MCAPGRGRFVFICVFEGSGNRVIPKGVGFLALNGGMSGGSG